MPRKILCLFAAAFLSAALIFPASAHPGDTDSNGGHYNRSTGEYHYHHGYPEHQHTNGICPYDYDDKTGQNSGPSGNSGNVRPSPVPPSGASPKSGPEIHPLFWVLLSVVVCIFPFWLLSRGSSNPAPSILSSAAPPPQKPSYAEQLRSELDDLKIRLAVLRAEVGDVEKLLFRPVSAPSGSYLDDRFWPREIGKEPPHDKYFFSISPGGKCHRPTCKHYNPSDLQNIYAARRWPHYLSTNAPLSPCKICSPQFPDTDWVDRHLASLRNMPDLLRILGVNSLHPQKPPRSQHKSLYHPHRKPFSYSSEAYEPPEIGVRALTVLYNGSVIPLFSVESSAISHIGYDLDAQNLFIRMKESSIVYVYKDVPYHFVTEFRYTPSAGKLYNAHIKGKYRSDIVGKLPDQ